jgi:hypothetical protein
MCTMIANHCLLQYYCILLQNTFLVRWCESKMWHSWLFLGLPELLNEITDYWLLSILLFLVTVLRGNWHINQKNSNMKLRRCYSYVSRQEWAIANDSLYVQLGWLTLFCWISISFYHCSSCPWSWQYCWPDRGPWIKETECSQISQRGWRNKEGHNQGNIRVPSKLRVEW